MASSSLPQRRNTLRSRTHDYRGNGYYLITVRVYKFRHLLGYVAEKRMHMSPIGAILLDQIECIPTWSPVAVPDRVAVMPSHWHIVLRIRDNLFDCSARTGDGPVASSVSVVIGQLKSRTTVTAIRAGLWVKGEPLWHRSFHDRVLPDLRAVNAARRYLDLNPVRWEQRYGPGGP